MQTIACASGSVRSPSNAGVRHVGRHPLRREPEHGEPEAGWIPSEYC